MDDSMRWRNSSKTHGVISVLPLDHPGLLLIEPRVFEDARGVFAETFRAEILAEAGSKRPFVQENTSISTPQGAAKGLHFQVRPHAHDKLVRGVRGAMLYLAVDTRKGSPTFGSRGPSAAFLWSDTALGVAWPLDPSEAIVSDKDAVLPLLAELETHFNFGEA